VRATVMAAPTPFVGHVHEMLSTRRLIDNSPADRNRLESRDLGALTLAEKWGVGPTCPLQGPRKTSPSWRQQKGPSLAVPCPAAFLQLKVEKKFDQKATCVITYTGASFGDRSKKAISAFQRVPYATLASTVDDTTCPLP
jgi:hypothetical protein